MFDRRLKIFLIVVFGITLVLMARALQIQVVQHADWVERGKKVLIRPQLVETVRGRILDVKGRVLAEDVPCIDAMVDYRAVLHDPDEKWLREIAGIRLGRRLGDDYTKAGRSKRDAMAKPEMLVVKKDLALMWHTLAQCPGMDEQKIEDARQAIIRKVENRRRWIWYRNYQLALDTHDKRAPEPWYTRWLLDDDKPPELDEFKVTVGDELASYPVVAAIDPDTITLLGKQLDRFPGLSLRPSTHRAYPYKEIGCHWIGTLAPVTRDERASDREFNNDLRRYDYNDLIGRTGIEALAEPALRGTRGLIERTLGSTKIDNETPAKPGDDVRTTVDIELQGEIQDIFRHVTVKQRDKPDETYELHGAAVVIDVPTGQVRAMASYPGFDPNTLDQTYAQLSVDRLNNPLLNRATMDALEPGSTVKPMVGLWGMREGVLKFDETIECTGYLMINGRKQPWGRCWVASKFETVLRSMGLQPDHHRIPSEAPHPTGFLTFADALERSCNPFHETVAMRLGLYRLSEGYAAFGLGQPTDIGIAERIGRLPTSYAGNPHQAGPAIATAGIGQGPIAATPLQMAGVAATVARSGIWLRPSLLVDTLPPDKLRPTTRPTSRPSRVDLKIPPEAIAMAQLGMWNVVHSPAGTGKMLKFDEVGACGKTGTAQAAQFMVPQLDANGSPVPKLDAEGKPMLDSHGKPRMAMVPLEISTLDHPNPAAPWYLGSGNSGTDLAHAWYIGFAPRENPKIAFCVLVEYGGSGGITAAAVAHDVLAACVEHGYLSR